MIFNRENNPYTLQFSFVPPQYINRLKLTEDIVGDFTKAVPAFRCHFITGVRGTGKTVAMAGISHMMEQKADWVVVDIEDPEHDIMDSLARGLYRNADMRALFVKAKLDLSIIGLGVSIESAEAIASNETDALDYMLRVLKKSGKRVLVAIDEVTYCKQIASFSHTLSSYARKGYDVYVLMTGLKENIKSIKNDKSLTFLYRAKEHVLESLNITAITANYKKVFDVERECAEKMAYMTKGYSFAFQLLGYLLWEYASECNIEVIDWEKIIPEYDQYLAEFVYEKIWSELPAKEKSVLKAIDNVHSGAVKSVRAEMNMKSSEFSVYRERLMDRGLIDGSEYGKVRYTLPRFGEFVRVKY